MLFSKNINSLTNPRSRNQTETDNSGNNDDKTIKSGVSEKLSISYFHQDLMKSDNAGQNLPNKEKFTEVPQNNFRWSELHAAYCNQKELAKNQKGMSHKT